jgi:hypothetical protein
MTDTAVRVAMWSGPRNISTAMMRSFEARGDAAVSDEPFYAAYLARTGIDHPLREEVIASQSCDPREVGASMVGPVPGGLPIWYQKHMTLHMLEDFDRQWMAGVRNAFLIREPRAVLASYVQKRAHVTLADIGFVQQRELFEREADRLGRAPPVVDAADVLANPARTLERLCHLRSSCRTRRRCCVGLRVDAPRMACGRRPGITPWNNRRVSIRRNPRLLTAVARRNCGRLEEAYAAGRPRRYPATALRSTADLPRSMYCWSV